MHDALLADRHEHIVPTDGIIQGGTLASWRLSAPLRLAGFALRLHAPLPAAGQVLSVGLRIDGALRPERARLPGVPRPFNAHCALGQNAHPFDAAQEFQAVIDGGLALSAGQTLELVAVDAPEPPPGGIVLRLIPQGRRHLTGMARPWVEERGAGPVCRIPWSPAEIVHEGSETAGDADCSPQNNSGIVADPDGTL